MTLISLHDDLVMVDEQGNEISGYGPEIAPPLIERGGPGSGHHGHEGRPGRVGGSQPSGVGASADRRVTFGSAKPSDAMQTYRQRIAGSKPQFSIRTVGTGDPPTSLAVDSFAEAVRVWDEAGRVGHIDVVDPERAFWASFGFQESLDVDSVDWNAEYQMFVEVHDYMLEALNDPEFGELARLIDRHGEYMVDNAQIALDRWNAARARGEEVGRLDNRAGYNIIFTNDREYVGAGSGGVGHIGGKVFWQPLSLAEDESALSGAGFMFGLSPAYVQFHELHHGYGSSTELDRFSDTIALDYYMKKYDSLPAYMQDAVVDKAFSTYNWASLRLTGQFREGRLQTRQATAWLYSRNPDFYHGALDARRRYEADDTGGAPYSYWLFDPDGSEARLKRWRSEYRIKP